MSSVPSRSIYPRRYLAVLFFCLAVVGFLSAAPARADLKDGIDAFEREDYTTAARELRPYAERGIAMVQFLLGGLYMYGNGVPLDYDEARKWLLLAAHNNLKEAQLALGYMHFDGLGVVQDYNEAERWSRKSAEQGYALAQSLMGRIYFNAFGVPEDFEQAAYWYGLAAEQGDYEGQFFFGLSHWGGVGVRRDLITAYKWMSLAADHESEQAQEEIESYAEEMTSDEIAEADRLAEVWRVEHYNSKYVFRQALSSGFPRALRELREMNIDE